LPPLLVERARRGSSSVGNATALLDKVVLCWLGRAELGKESTCGIGLYGLLGRPLVDDVVVLADVFEQAFPLKGLLFPPHNVVIRLLLLQSAEEGLVLKSYLDELFPPEVPIKALFLTACLR